MNKMDLTNKTAIVTGGSRGIGRAICQKLASLGARIVINYAGNDAEAEKTRALCPESVLVKGDVSDSACCQEILKVCEDTFGAPDILVNNAGITRDNLLMRMSEEDFDRVLAVNLKGAFHLTKLATRPMLRQKSGRIVNVASVVGICGNAGQANYAASKAGLIGLTKSTAKELAARGITVNAVAPGLIETDMTAVLGEDLKNEMRKSIPLARFGRGEDVANAVAFLCSDLAGYITGQVIHVDGGMLI
jgi:3-oxoacyl-[acyl-carrier protein] reductase